MQVHQGSSHADLKVRHLTAAFPVTRADLRAATRSPRGTFQIEELTPA